MADRVIPLSSTVGELMAPHTLVTALIVTPQGEVSLEPGALHGRSALESRLTMVPQRALLGEGEVFLVVWVAIELDASDNPFRYKGLTVSELFVNAKQHLAFKSLAEHVNRMSGAIRGDVNATQVSPAARRGVKAQLINMGTEVWNRSAPSFQEALAS